MKRLNSAGNVVRTASPIPKYRDDKLMAQAFPEIAFNGNSIIDLKPWRI